MVVTKMINNQNSLNLSPFMELYDLIVPQNHILREINTLVDFSFVYEELKDNYCLNNGRNAVHPIQMFKYLLLKFLYNLSDIGVVERASYDMSFKYFLDLAPEAKVIDPSLLTKFRKQRLKDVKLLDLLLAKSLEIARANGVLKNHTLLLDSTHTEARYRKTRIKEMLAKQASLLVNAMLAVKKDLSPPKEPSNMANTEKVRAYCQELIEIFEASDLASMPEMKEHKELLKEMLDGLIDTFDYSYDKEARIGHKSEIKSFYGYKTHYAMNEDRIITAAVITSGESFDGRELIGLVEKSEENGCKVEEVIGDRAYSTIENITEMNEKKISLISRMNPGITRGTRKEDRFIYNKDAGKMQCPASHLSTRTYKNIRKDKKKSTTIRYYFDIEKCKQCHMREGCYKEGSKSKAYYMTVKSDMHQAQKKFEETEYFKERIKVRYMIEGKNSEIKNQHGYNQAEALGLAGMNLQGAVTLFAVNLKRIIKLKGEVRLKSEEYPQKDEK